MAGQGDDRNVPLRADATGGLDPVEARQDEVEQDHVRLVLSSKLDRLHAVACLGADREAGALEQKTQVGANDRVGLDGQNAGSRLNGQFAPLPSRELYDCLGNRGSPR